jgi:TRAP-type C4-dicarboxylate transport system substrate-binding protein
MNLKKWDSLPPDLQKTIEKVSDEYSEKANKLMDSSAEEIAASQKAKGHTFITLSSEEEKRWATKIAPVFDEWVKDKSAKGLPAAEVLKFCRDWIEKNQK